MLRYEHDGTSLPVLLALWKLRQEDFEFEANLNYIVRLCLVNKVNCEGIEKQDCCQCSLSQISFFFFFLNTLIFNIGNCYVSLAQVDAPIPMYGVGRREGKVWKQEGNRRRIGVGCDQDKLHICIRLSKNKNNP